MAVSARLPAGPFSVRPPAANTLPQSRWRGDFAARGSCAAGHEAELPRTGAARAHRLARGFWPGRNSRVLAQTPRNVIGQRYLRRSNSRAAAQDPRSTHTPADAHYPESQVRSSFLIRPRKNTPRRPQLDRRLEAKPRRVGPPLARGPAGHHLLGGLFSSLGAGARGGRFRRSAEPRVPRPGAGCSCDLVALLGVLGHGAHSNQLRSGIRLPWLNPNCPTISVALVRSHTSIRLSPGCNQTTRESSLSQRRAACRTQPVSAAVEI
jgi:hypothetical protein